MSEHNDISQTAQSDACLQKLRRNMEAHSAEETRISCLKPLDGFIIKLDTSERVIEGYLVALSTHRRQLQE